MMNVTCDKVVSLLEAMIFGAGEACVSLGMWSIATFALGFIVAVAILKFVGVAIIRKARGGPKMDAEPTPAPGSEVTLVGKTDYDGGPIKTLR